MKLLIRTSDDVGFPPKLALVLEWRVLGWLYLVLPVDLLLQRELRDAGSDSRRGSRRDAHSFRLPTTQAATVAKRISREVLVRIRPPA